MDVSHFLAKVLGSYMLIIAAIWLVRKDQFGQTLKSVLGSGNTYSLTAIIQIIFGLLIIISHPVWSFDWRVLITLIGYFALIQGVIRLAFPEETKGYFLDTERGFWVLIVSFFIFGGILAYHGFISG